MSFLLDALRKSERSGRRQNAPTIHSDAPAGASSGESGGDLLPLLAFLVPAFLLMSWFGLHQFDVGPFARAATAVSPDTGVAQEPVGQGVNTPITQGPVEKEQSAGESGRDTLPQFVGGGAENASRNRPRTPVEQVDQGPAQAGTGGGAAARPDPLAESSRAIAEAMAATDADQQRAAGSMNADGVDQQAATAGPKATAPTARENHIDYWELPDNIRNQLPEMKLSVLVYADQPEDRFILLNGQRLYEGDEVQPGLVMQEVRREGAIFRFRRYRFIYTN
jgi:general secretion pathway protein B